MRRNYKPKKKPTAFDTVLAQRAARKHEELIEKIDTFLAFTAEHPSVHDKMGGASSTPERTPSKQESFKGLV